MLAAVKISDDVGRRGHRRCHPPCVPPYTAAVHMGDGRIAVGNPQVMSARVGDGGCLRRRRGASWATAVAVGGRLLCIGDGRCCGRRCCSTASTCGPFLPTSSETGKLLASPWRRVHRRRPSGPGMTSACLHCRCAGDGRYCAMQRCVHRGRRMPPRTVTTRRRPRPGAGRGGRTSWPGAGPRSGARHGRAQGHGRAYVTARRMSRMGVRHGRAQSTARHTPRLGVGLAAMSR